MDDKYTDMECGVLLIIDMGHEKRRCKQMGGFDKRRMEKSSWTEQNIITNEEVLAMIGKKEETKEMDETLS